MRANDWKDDPHWFSKFAVILFVLAVGISVSYFYGQSLLDSRYKELPYMHEDNLTKSFMSDVLLILDKTYKYASDYNGDSLINCIDYACIFKTLWDKSYINEDCEIVRNENRLNDFHHLFVRVRQSSLSPWIYVEPIAAATNIYMFYMEDYWDYDVYNPVFNIYGETDYWLQQRKVYGL